MDPALLRGLPGVISKARLSTYLDRYPGREDLALRLYSWNIALTSALWGPFSVVEVAVRNAIHTQLEDRAGRSDWWGDPHLWSRLLDRQQQEISAAIDTAQRRIDSPTTDDVVAGSSFGLWVGLLSAGIPRHPLLSYETTLWQPRLHRAFPHYQGGRRQLHGELDAIRKMRNRIAHHEPIFRSNIAFILDTAAKVVGYIDPDAEHYIRDSEQVSTVVAAKREFVALGQTRF